MPIYEYRCTRCGHQLDVLQKVSDEPLTVCPACNENTLVKKVSAPRFRLKGGGWYETDFKSGNKRNVAGDGEPSSTGASGSATGGGESGSGGEKGGAADAKSPSSSDGATKPAASGSKSSPSEAG